MKAITWQHPSEVYSNCGLMLFLALRTHYTFYYTFTSYLTVIVKMQPALCVTLKVPRKKPDFLVAYLEQTAIV